MNAVVTPEIALVISRDVFGVPHFLLSIVRFSKIGFYNTTEKCLYVF